MNKNKGFTLVELLAVIVVIGLLVTFVTPSVLNILESARNSTHEEDRRNVLDGALTYALSNRNMNLTVCEKGFTPTDINSTSTPGCTSKVTIKELKDKGYITDSKKHCDEEAVILIYNEYKTKDLEGDPDSDSDDLVYGEYKVYAPKGICGE